MSFILNPNLIVKREDEQSKIQNSSDKQNVEENAPLQQSASSQQSTETQPKKLIIKPNLIASKDDIQSTPQVKDQPEIHSDQPEILQPQTSETSTPKPLNLSFFKPELVVVSERHQPDQAISQPVLENHHPEQPSAVIEKEFQIKVQEDEPKEMFIQEETSEPAKIDCAPVVEDKISSDLESCPVPEIITEISEPIIEEKIETDQTVQIETPQDELQQPDNEKSRDIFEIVKNVEKSKVKVAEPPQKPAKAYAMVYYSSLDASIIIDNTSSPPCITHYCFETQQSHVITIKEPVKTAILCDQSVIVPSKTGINIIDINSEEILPFPFEAPVTKLLLDPKNEKRVIYYSKSDKMVRVFDIDDIDPRIIKESVDDVDISEQFMLIRKANQLSLFLRVDTALIPEWTQNVPTNASFYVDNDHAYEFLDGNVTLYNIRTGDAEDIITGVKQIYKGQCGVCLQLLDEIIFNDEHFSTPNVCGAFPYGNLVYWWSDESSVAPQVIRAASKAPPLQLTKPFLVFAQEFIANTKIFIASSNDAIIAQSQAVCNGIEESLKQISDKITACESSLQKVASSLISPEQDILERISQSKSLLESDFSKAAVQINLIIAEIPESASQKVKDSMKELLNFALSLKKEDDETERIAVFDEWAKSPFVQ